VEISGFNTIITLNAQAFPGQTDYALTFKSMKTVTLSGFNANIFTNSLLFETFESGTIDGFDGPVQVDEAKFQSFRDSEISGFKKIFRGSFPALLAICE